MITLDLYKEIISFLKSKYNHTFDYLDRVNISKDGYNLCSNILCSKCNYEFLLDLRFMKRKNAIFYNGVYNDNIYYDFRCLNGFSNIMNNMTCEDCIIKSIIE